MHQNDGGYIVVETIGCFLLFVFLNLSILSLINIVTVQARIHYALSQAAESVSMYTYVLNQMGVTDHLVKNAKKTEGVEKGIDEVKSHINDAIKAIEGLDVSKTVDAGQTLYQDGVNVYNGIKEDPKAAFQLFLDYGVQKGLDGLFATAIKSLVGHYLENGNMSGDAYLKLSNVDGGLDGLSFNDGLSTGLNTKTGNDSRFLTGEENVKIVVEYNIDYTFGALPLPFTKLHIAQEVMTRAWLNGVGPGYSG